MVGGRQIIPGRALPALLVVVLLAACAAEDWIPKGELELAQLYETVDADLGGACLVFRIRNSGKSAIEKTTAAIKMTTDQDVYYITLEHGSAVPAGKSAYAESRLTYRHAEESASPEGLVIESVFFD